MSAIVQQLLATVTVTILTLLLLQEKSIQCDEVVRGADGYFRCPLSPITERYADPNDRTCRYFFLCHRGHAFPKQCGLRLGFHPKRRACMPRNEIPEDLCEFDITCGFNGYYADPKDCTKYYLCFYNVPTHYGCTDGRVFDPKTSTCKADKKRAHECSRPTPLPHFSTTTVAATRGTPPTTTTTIAPRPTTPSPAKAPERPKPILMNSDPIV